MQKFLITFGTRALAQRLANLLKNKYTVEFATSEEVPLFLQANFLAIPKGVNPTFAHELLKICLDKQIHYLLPIGQQEIQAISQAKQLFEEYDIQVLTPDMEELEEVLLINNPGASADIHVYHKGKSLDLEYKLNKAISGVFVISDDGDNLALCTV